MKKLLLILSLFAITTPLMSTEFKSVVYKFNKRTGNTLVTIRYTTEFGNDTTFSKENISLNSADSALILEALDSLNINIK